MPARRSGPRPSSPTGPQPEPGKGQGTLAEPLLRLVRGERVDLPEIEDQPWCPPLVRDALTDLLSEAALRLRLFAATVPLLAEMCRRSADARIVDLCSGAGGPLLALLPRLARDEGLKPKVVLTDKFPNLAALAAAEAAFAPQVRAWRQSVDAARVPPQLRGVRTIFNAFHHFPPPLARAILADAKASGQPIVVVETVARNRWTVPFVLGVPWFVWGMTPFVRPTLARLALTYAVPLIPLVATWDALASNLRAYSVAELQELVAPLQSPTYRFVIGHILVPRLPQNLTVLAAVPLRRPGEKISLPGLIPVG